ncbi:chemoreceptor glutamine deamidase CheD [Aestuariibacter sp. A3R04]|uniref:chemoreceptor glutamine deamidase CheD n=1 Tax=Aestuariibacter sp. A3R04 TaxID=2841571 RepID=UPI001C090683|nr:chemoreceptor glutamine deamidase CheD [Aestuariibacter sp. A3R04]MBU3021170.1 chemoreceptor glutamine deamidase CheD [Aestuariibacter sp. A3R04]
MVEKFNDGKAQAANTYFDARFVRQAVKILPGEYFATSNDTLMVTVVGCCVSTCLMDLHNGVTGINHFLLPSDKGAEGEFCEASRYGMYAMELLINQMLALGADKRHMQAKVFGGGNVVSGISITNPGQINAEFVTTYLRRENIPLIASDLLEDYARKIYFFPDTGEVLVKRIRKYNNSTIMDRESAYRMKLRERPDEGIFELFE